MAQLSPEDYYALVGKACVLWLASGYRPLSTNNFRTRITRPLKAGRALVLSLKDSSPVAFVSWAFRPEDEPICEILRLLKTEEDWSCGPHMHIVDFIAPFGHMPQTIRKLRELSQAVYPNAYMWLGYRSRLQNSRVNPVRLRVGGIQNER